MSLSAVKSLALKMTLPSSSENREKPWALSLARSRMVTFTPSTGWLPSPIIRKHRSFSVMTVMVASLSLARGARGQAPAAMRDMRVDAGWRAEAGTEASTGPSSQAKISPSQSCMRRLTASSPE